MGKYFAPFVLASSLLAMTSCSQSDASPQPQITQEQDIAVSDTIQPEPESAPALPPRPDPNDYLDFLDEVSVKRQSFANDSDAKASLFQWIDKDMYAYWERTTWGFNGVSRTPGHGEIACGYFVTTLLKDLGFDIDRVRLAQDVSATMIKELTDDIKITRTIEGMISYVESQPSGSVFIVGLDFHTGFITSGPDGIYFLHSNYIGREGVVREKAATSAALHESGYFMIGNLSTRTDTIEAWRAGLVRSHFDDLRITRE